jgi:opacity protein-like surface antigen
MLLKQLLCLSALSLAASAPALAADPSMRPAPGAQHMASGGGGVAWGLKPGFGQLGAAGFGYYRTDNCWRYESMYDGFDDYLGNRRVNICVATPGG